jgi:hypothetical protein
MSIAPLHRDVFIVWPNDVSDVLGANLDLNIVEFKDLLVKNHHVPMGLLLHLL